MLFMKDAAGIQAVVQLRREGIRLNEYEELHKKDQEYDKPETRCEAYLECVEGEDFMIKLIKTQGTEYDYSVTGSLDGRDIGRKLFYAKDQTCFIDTMRVQGDRGQPLLSNFAFAALATTDNDAEVEVSGRELDQLCKIEISILRGKIEVRKRKGLPQFPSAKATVGMVKESKFKMGSTINATKGRRIRQKPPSRTVNRFIEDPTDPFVCRLVWTYFTKDKLTIMGIIDDEGAEPEETAVAKPDEGIDMKEVNLTKRERSNTIGVEDGVELVRRIKREDTGVGSRTRPFDIDEPERNVERKPIFVDLTLDTDDEDWEHLL